MAAAVAKAWQDVSWPAELVSHTVYADADGQRIVHYSQATGRDGFAFDKARWAAGVDATVPGIQRRGMTAYRRYRSVRSHDGTPGCVVIVSFTVDDTADATDWIDRLVDAGTQNNPPAGMLSAHFHVSLDGTRILNVAEWSSSTSHQASVDSRPAHTDAPIIRVVDTTPGVQFAGWRRYPWWHHAAAPT